MVQDEVAGAERSSRRSGQAVVPGDLAASPFRADRDRIASSPFFSRLGGVTQVVSPSGSGLLLHNRLTHSLKVAQVGRAIAERLLRDPVAKQRIDRLGGLNPDVVEAAGLGHDLGHPPFGHLGEGVLDRIARVQAEFENARRREAKERTEFRDYALGQAAEGLLPVLDNFDLALKSNGTPEQFRSGVELIAKQLDEAVRGLGLTHVETVGTQFDPHVHEALLLLPPWEGLCFPAGRHQPSTQPRLLQQDSSMQSCSSATRSGVLHHPKIVSLSCKDLELRLQACHRS